MEKLAFVNLETWAQARRRAHDEQLAASNRALAQYEGYNDAVERGDWQTAGALLEERRRANGGKTR